MMARNWMLGLLLWMIGIVNCDSNDVCTPACRIGYVCMNGGCVSPCNPPCGADQVCTSLPVGYLCVAASYDGSVGGDASSGMDVRGGCGICSGATPVCGPNGVCVGDPEVVGCSDGSREGFASIATYPSIAACAGHWMGGQNLRAMPTGRACGEPAGGICPGPTDLCARGWHVCLRNGWPGDLMDRISGDDCHAAVAGIGVFLAASDTTSSGERCTRTLPMSCVGTSLCNFQTVACGTAARAPLGFACGSRCDALWPSNTWAGFYEPGACNDAHSDRSWGPGATGVLCCRDPEIAGH